MEAAAPQDQSEREMIEDLIARFENLNLNQGPEEVNLDCIEESNLNDYSKNESSSEMGYSRQRTKTKGKNETSKLTPDHLANNLATLTITTPTLPSIENQSTIEELYDENGLL